MMIFKYSLINQDKPCRTIFFNMSKRNGNIAKEILNGANIAEVATSNELSRIRVILMCLDFCKQYNHELYQNISEKIPI